MFTDCYTKHDYLGISRYFKKITEKIKYWLSSPTNPNKKPILSNTGWNRTKFLKKHTFFKVWISGWPSGPPKKPYNPWEFKDFKTPRFPTLFATTKLFSLLTNHIEWLWVWTLFYSIYLYFVHELFDHKNYYWYAKSN